VKRLAWAALGCALILSGNDTFVHQSAGNLMFVRNTQVAIRKERLIVGPPVQDAALQKPLIPIHVEYQLENTTGQPVHADVGFPLPACSLGDYLDGKQGSYETDHVPTCVKQPEMKLLVDGSPVSGKWDFVFIRDGKLLTGDTADSELGARIREAFALIRAPHLATPEDNARLERAENSLCERLGGQMRDYTCPAFARVTVQSTFLWEYQFPAGKRTTVVHDYSVQPSINLDPSDVFASDLSSATDVTSNDAFCVNDSSSRAAWAKYQKDPTWKESSYLRAFFTEYVLHTGALWAGPIGDFELLIRKSSPSQLVFTCFSGLVKTNAVEFRAHRTNFSPAEDLRILYIPPE
jgi:hypothetical protein